MKTASLALSLALWLAVPSRADVPPGDKYLELAEVRELANDQWIHALCLAPDGKHLAAATGEHDVVVWDLVTAKKQQTVTTEDGWVSSIAYAPSGKTLITGSSTGAITEWDLATGKSGVAIPASPKESPSDGGGAIKITPDAIRTGAHSGPITVLTVSHNGKIIAAVSDDGTSTLWDIEGKRIARITSPIVTCAFNWNDTELSTFSRTKMLGTYDTRSGSLTREVLLPDFSAPAAFSSDGTRLYGMAGYGQDDKGRRWVIGAVNSNATSGSASRIIVVQGSRPENASMSVAPDETAFFMGNSQFLTLYHPMSADVHTSAERLGMIYLDGTPDQWVVPPIVSPDGTVVIYADRSHTIRVWQLEKSTWQKDKWDRHRPGSAGAKPDFEDLGAAGVE